MEPRGFWVLTGEPGGQARPTDREASTIAGAGDYARLKKVDFSEVPQSDQPALDQLAQRLLQQMSWRLSRRRKLAEIARRGGSEAHDSRQHQPRRRSPRAALQRPAAAAGSRGDPAGYQRLDEPVQHVPPEIRPRPAPAFQTRRDLCLQYQAGQDRSDAAIAEAGGGHESPRRVSRRLVGRHQDRRIAQRVQREACKVVVARHRFPHFERWVGHREPRRVGGGASQHQKPGSQSDLAESAPGSSRTTSRLPAGWPRLSRTWMCSLRRIRSRACSNWKST